MLVACGATSYVARSYTRNPANVSGSIETVSSCSQHTQGRVLEYTNNGVRFCFTETSGGFAYSSDIWVDWSDLDNLQINHGIVGILVSAIAPTNTVQMAGSYSYRKNWEPLYVKFYSGWSASSANAAYEEALRHMK